MSRLATSRDSDRGSNANGRSFKHTMDTSSTTRQLQPRFLRCACNLVLLMVVMTAIAAVLHQLTKGAWWDRSYWLSLTIPLVIVPLAVWVIFVPRSIEWNDERCVIRSRLHGVVSYEWKELFGFGPGRNVFVLQFKEGPRLQIYAGAFESGAWQAFRDYLRSNFPDRARTSWPSPKRQW